MNPHWKLTSEDKARIAVWERSIARLMRLQAKGQKTISKKKVDEMFQDIVYREMAFMKSPFKDMSKTIPYNKMRRV